MNAAVAATKGAGDSDDSVADALLLPGPGWTNGDLDEPIEPLSVAEFKRVGIELGVFDAHDIDALTDTIPSDPSAFARSLIQSGILSAYQACAIQQGNARGLLVGRYLVLDKIGEGGMGVVFKARHRKLGRVVALKILPPSFARNRVLALRFRREAQVAARLDHPNIVSVFDADEDRGVYFLAMDYIEGRDLDHLVRDHGPLTIAQAIDCVIQAARGLDAAHVQGIVHRDIKPGNLMLDGSGVIRVLDLGLARLVRSSSEFGQPVDTNLTRSGTYMGTVDFMAPEQAEDSSRVDHRADIYSLGCSLYFLLTGRPPFERVTLLQRIVAHCEQPPPSLRDIRPDASAPLDAAYQAMMAKRPNDRPRSMAEVISLLEACQKTIPEIADQSRAAKSLSTSVLSNSGTLIENPETTPRSAPGVLRFESASIQGPHADPSAVGSPRNLDASSALRCADSTALPTNTWRRRARFAVIGTLGVLVGIVLIMLVAQPRRGSGSRRDITSAQSTEPRATTTRTEPLSLLETSASPPETTVEPNQILLAVAPKTAPEPRPAVTAGDLSRPAHAKDRNPPIPLAPNAPTYDVVRVFTKHTGELRSIAVTHDGRFALTSSQDRTARFWEVNTGKEVVLPLKHPSGVMDAAISPDGRFALTATHGLANRNGALRLWNLATGKTIFNGMGDYHVGPIRAITFIGNARGLSGGQDGRVILWNLDRRGQVRTLGIQIGPVHLHAIAVFPNRRRALTAGKDRLVHVWEMTAGKELGQWAGHEGLISDVAISPDGRRAVTGSHDRTVILWDTATGSPVHRFSMPGQDFSPSVAILRDGNVMAAGGAFGQLVLWDRETFSIVRQARPPLIPHVDLAALPDGLRVLTADQDGVVRLWTPHTP
jgi:serine/threonine protein kinase